MPHPLSPLDVASLLQSCPMNYLNVPVLRDENIVFCSLIKFLVFFQCNEWFLVSIYIVIRWHCYLTVPQPLLPTLLLLKFCQTAKYFLVSLLWQVLIEYFINDVFLLTSSYDIYCGKLEDCLCPVLLLPCQQLLAHP